jgi:DNA-binding LytR/AlgR family response regulator
MTGTRREERATLVAYANLLRHQPNAVRGDPSTGGGATARMTDLRGRRILIVEDEYLVADDLARDLGSLGAEIVGPVGTLTAAVSLLRSGARLDGAVLDINLHGEMSYPVAALLAETGTPFLFVTGYDAWTIDDRYRDVPRYEKPIHSTDVVAALFRR